MWRWPFSSDRHKANRRSGALCHTAELTYVPRNWPPQLDNTKSGDGRSGPTGVSHFGEAAFFQSHSQSGLRPEEQPVATGQVEMWRWPFSSDRHKANRRSGALCHTAELTYVPRTWPPQLDKTKSGDGRSGPTGVSHFGEAAFFQSHSQSGLRPEEQPVATGQLEMWRRAFWSDRRKPLWRSGVFSVAQPEWLTSRGTARRNWTTRNVETHNKNSL